MEKIFEFFKFSKINKKELLIVLLIIVIGLVLRLYRIDEYMTFLGDEGRDVLVVRRLLVNFDLVFVGPGTSVGDMYLGPMYYYMIAPFLYLWNFSPVGPAVFVALLGTATIFLVYVFTKEISGKIGGYWASILYAISPTVIIFSKHSWNPNIMPFFSVLAVYCLYKIIDGKKYNYVYLLGFCLSAIAQSHYLGLILLPLVFMYLLMSFVSSNKKTEIVKKFLISFFMFLVFMSPLFLFDFKHNLRNLNSFLSFFVSERAVSFDIQDVVLRIPDVTRGIISSLLGVKNAVYTAYSAFSIVLLLMYKFLFRRERYNKKKVSGLILMLSWLAIGIVGLALYQKEIYDHYFGFLFTAPFILLGILLNDLFLEKRKVMRIIGFILPVPIAIGMVLGSPVNAEPSRQMARTIETSKKIMEEARGEKINLAVIADQNYEGAYQYFLEMWDAPLLVIDPQRYTETKAEYLFVVCEYEDRTKCQPTSNPKAEVANFGWSKIENSWEVGGALLFKLVENK